MSDIKRKIIISADSREAESSFDRMGDKLSGAFDGANAANREFLKTQEETVDLFKQMNAEAGAGGKIGQAKLKQLEKEINLIERIGKKESERSKASARTKLDERLKEAKGMAPGMARQEFVIGARSEYNKSMKKAELDEKLQQTQNNVLNSNLSREKEKSVIVRHEGDEDSGEGFGGKIKHGLSRMGEGAMEALGFGTLLSASGLLAKSIEEAIKLEGAQGKASGFGRGLASAGGATAYGLSDADFIQYARKSSMAMGKVNVGESRRQLATETGFGLEHGQLEGLNRSMRLSKSVEASGGMAEMLALFKKSGVFGIDKGDFTMIGEKVEQAATMNSEQVKQTGEVNMRISAGLLAAGGTMGGTWAQDPTATFGKVNQAIQNPGNDFKRAFLFRSLKDVNPDADMFDVQKMQESGVYGKGVMSSVLGRLQKTYKGKELYRNTSKMLGLKGFEAEGLMDQFAKTPDMFKGEMSEKDLRKFGVTGAGHAGKTEVWKANLENTLAGAGNKGIEAVDTLMKGAELLKEAAGSIIDQILNESGAMGEKGTKQNAERQKWLNQVIPTLAKVAPSKMNEFNDLANAGGFNPQTGIPHNKEGDAMRAFFDKNAAGLEKLGDHRPLSDTQERIAEYNKQQAELLMSIARNTATKVKDSKTGVRKTK